MKTPKTAEERIRRLERRLDAYESRIEPWVLSKGRYGDLVATNRNTGKRVVVARADIEPQNTK